MQVCGNGVSGIQHSVQNSEFLVVELQQKLDSIYVPLQRQNTWDTVPKAYFAVLLIVWRVWHLCLGSRFSLVGVLWKFSSTRFNGARFLKDMRIVLRELREALVLNLSGTGLSFSLRSARSWCFRQATVALTFWSTDAILFQFSVNFISKTIKMRAKLRYNKVQSSVKKEKWKSSTQYIWLHLPERRKLELSRLFLGVLKENRVDFYSYLGLHKSTKKPVTAIPLQDSSLKVECSMSGYLCLRSRSDIPTLCLL